MFERLFGDRAQDPALAGRIPPGQYRTEKFPVLHYGSVPHTDLATWDFKVWGEVETPFEFDWAEFQSMPRKTVHTDVHCVTRWSRFDNRWEGVAVSEILSRARVRPEAVALMVHGEQDYTTNLLLSDLQGEGALLALKHDGKDLPAEHGGPCRLVVPQLYFWKSSKWIRGLQFLPKDQLGFWERYGYNNNADPWKEQRFTDD